MQRRWTALLVVLVLPAPGLPVVPRASQLDGPVWGVAYESGNELADNRISSDDGAVVFDAPAAPPAGDREIEGILEQPVEALLGEGVVARLRALGDPRLAALLAAPARLLVARPAEVRAALGRPVYQTLSARAAHLLARLPARLRAEVARLLRLPLRDLLRRDPALEPLLRSFINTPPIPPTCPPGQRVAHDGSCRDAFP